LSRRAARRWSPGRGGCGARAVQHRPTDLVRASDDLHEPALHEAAQHLAARDAADRLQVGAEDRLAVRDDRERLERRLGQPALLAHALEARDHRTERRKRHHLATAGDALDPERASVGLVTGVQRRHRVGHLGGGTLLLGRFLGVRIGPGSIVARLGLPATATHGRGIDDPEELGDARIRHGSVGDQERRFDALFERQVGTRHGLLG
jgi:hypothetical protein